MLIAHARFDRAYYGDGQVRPGPTRRLNGGYRRDGIATFRCIFLDSLNRVCFCVCVCMCALVVPDGLLFAGVCVTCDRIFVCVFACCDCDDVLLCERLNAHSIEVIVRAFRFHCVSPLGQNCATDNIKCMRCTRAASDRARTRSARNGSDLRGPDTQPWRVRRRIKSVIAARAQPHANHLVHLDGDEIVGPSMSPVWASAASQ